MILTALTIIQKLTLCLKHIFLPFVLICNNEIYNYKSRSPTDYPTTTPSASPLNPTNSPVRFRIVLIGIVTSCIPNHSLLVFLSYIEFQLYYHIVHEPDCSS